MPKYHLKLPILTIEWTSVKLHEEFNNQKLSIKNENKLCFAIKIKKLGNLTDHLFVLFYLYIIKADHYLCKRSKKPLIQNL